MHEGQVGVGFTHGDRQASVGAKTDAQPVGAVELCDLLVPRLPAYVLTHSATRSCHAQGVPAPRATADRLGSAPRRPVVRRPQRGSVALVGMQLERAARRILDRLRRDARLPSPGLLRVLGDGWPSLRRTPPAHSAARAARTAMSGRTGSGRRSATRSAGGPRRSTRCMSGHVRLLTRWTLRWPTTRAITRPRASEGRDSDRRRRESVGRRVGPAATSPQLWRPSRPATARCPSRNGSLPPLHHYERADMAHTSRCEHLAADGLIFSPEGAVLLVKPSYRPHWEMPGGLVECGESPRRAVARELQEELGITVTPRQLLCVDWVSPEAQDSDMLILIFRCDSIDSKTQSVLRPVSDELTEARFFSLQEATRIIRPDAAHRLGEAVRAVGTNVVEYMERGFSVVDVDLD